MLAYKLLRERKDGTLGPLFINQRQRIPVGEWLTAEEHPTKGYAFRPRMALLIRPGSPAFIRTGAKVVSGADRGLRNVYTP